MRRLGLVSSLHEGLGAWGVDPIETSAVGHRTGRGPAARCPRGAAERASGGTGVPNEPKE